MQIGHIEKVDMSVLKHSYIHRGLDSQGMWVYYYAWKHDAGDVRAESRVGMSFVHDTGQLERGC